MKNFFNKLQEKMISDDAYHFVWGFFFTAILSFFTGWLPVLILGCTLSFGKELIDKYIRKTIFSTRDMVFSIIGTALVVLLKIITN